MLVQVDAIQFVSKFVNKKNYQMQNMLWSQQYDTTE
jgi:hypothetical protein